MVTRLCSRFTPSSPSSCSSRWPSSLSSPLCESLGPSAPSLPALGHLSGARAGAGPLLRGTGRRVECRQVEMAVTPLLISSLQGTSWPVRKEKRGCLLRVLVSVCSLLWARRRGDGWLALLRAGLKILFERGPPSCPCAGKCGCVSPLEE